MKLLNNKLVLLLLLLATFFYNCKSDKKEVVKNQMESTSKTELSENQLLDTIQKQTFNYFWEGAEPNSGLARERLHMDDIYPTSPKNTVTTGGSGFGLMAI